MPLRIIEDKETGQAVFTCTVSEWAFGPVMDNVKEAEQFVTYLERDPRSYQSDNLERAYSRFKRGQDE